MRRDESAPYRVGKRVAFQDFELSGGLAGPCNLYFEARQRFMDRTPYDVEIDGQIVFRMMRALYKGMLVAKKHDLRRRGQTQ